MTFIPNPDYKSFRYGDFVYLTENYAIPEGTFTKGHRFRIAADYWKSELADLIDDDNRKLHNVSYKYFKK